MENTKAILKITEGKDKACGKDFAGNDAAVVLLDNGNEALICSKCAEQL